MRKPGAMHLQGEPKDRSIGASLKATYRALLARGLETGEAANLTAFLHGLPSDGFHWSLAEIEGVLHRRIQHAAELRSAEVAARPGGNARSRTTIHDRRGTRRGSTRVIDPPTA